MPDRERNKAQEKALKREQNREKNEETLREAHERAKASVKKKEDSIVRTYEEPVMPSLCRILFWCMIILTAAMLLVDINAFVRYDSGLGLLHLYENVVLTGFGCWGIWAVLLLVLCAVGMKQAEGRYWKKRRESGVEDETQEDRARSRRAVRKLQLPFIRYMKVAAIGLVCWGALYVIYLVIR